MFGRWFAWLRSWGAPPRTGDPLWDVLARTGNGIGRAPGVLRALPLLDDESFFSVVCGEFDFAFLHQYTVYAATPFALDIVLDGMRPDQPRLLDLLLILDTCWQAEDVGPAPPSHSGVCFPEKDQAVLARAGIDRPTIAQVLSRHVATLRAIADTAVDPDAREVAAELVQRIDARARS